MITINTNKAKEISHNIRREARAKEFAPLDEVIMKRLPETDFDVIEAERQLVRDKYAAIQNDIEQAESADDLFIIVRQLRDSI